MNDHEIPNKDSFDEGETNYDNTNDYMTPNENLFNKRETDYENTNNYETPNKDSFDEVLNDNDEDFFNDEILDDYKNMNNRKTPNENLFDEVLNDEDEDFFNDEILDNDDEMPIDCNDKEQNKKGFDKVVDEALNIEQIPSINGEFAPYFKNITEVLMFFWIQKYNISTHAYEELVDIICHPQFKNEDVVANIRRFRKYRQRLPLLPIKTQNIHISNKKTPSTSKDTKEMYYLSITDIIWHSLNNLSIFSQMYFGPGIKVNKNQELWHGNLWKESPRFGQASIQFNGSMLLIVLLTL
ncbi:hypothetical protein C2G38_2027664 [Gigaspora rosea]|uniref:Uncharacterized protein n=1 Tax=Gigaspora rosea TaxID=44941 RepID=A0A397W877_9GLOM|nr:hypothetical protein C2G38_2027664 [Gigaspora rosea]